MHDVLDVSFSSLSTQFENTKSASNILISCDPIEALLGKGRLVSNLRDSTELPLDFLVRLGFNMH